MDTKKIIILAVLFWFIGAVGCSNSPTQPTVGSSVNKSKPEKSSPVTKSCIFRQDCATAVHQLVYKHWRVPPGLVQRGLNAIILVDLNEEGWIRELEYLKSSGNIAFDKSIEKALKRAQPYRMLTGLEEVRADGGILLKFIFRK